jgi:hypothetical protein
MTRTRTKRSGDDACAVGISSCGLRGCLVLHVVNTATGLRVILNEVHVWCLVLPGSPVGPQAMCDVCLGGGGWSLECMRASGARCRAAALHPPAERGHPLQRGEKRGLVSKPIFACFFSSGFFACPPAMSVLLIAIIVSLIPAFALDNGLARTPPMVSLVIVQL